MFAVIKKAKSDIVNKFPLPSKDDPVPLVALDNSDWTLLEFDKTMISAEALNEIIKNAPDSIVFNDEDSAKVIDYMDVNFKPKEPK